MIKMLANLSMQNQQLLYSSIYTYSSKPQVQQTTSGYNSRWWPEMVAAYKSPVALEMDASTIAVVPS